MEQMWDYFKVVWNFEGRLCGGVPLNKEVVKTWLEARQPKSKPEGAKSMEEVQAEVEGTIQEEMEKITTGFQSDGLGILIRSGNVRAHIKDCANQIKDFLGIQNFRSKVANRLYMDEYWIRPTRADGSPILESDGTYEQPVHVITPQGPRSGLKVIHFLNQPRLSFILRVLREPHVKKEKEKDKITRAVLGALFQYGSVHGFGAERSLGEGRYSFAIDPITTE